MGRKLTEEQKAQRAAARIAEKRKEALGPLFAYQAEPVDVQRLMLQRRLGHAKNMEHLHELLGHNHVLNALFARHLESVARRHIPADVVERLRPSAMSPELQVSSWLDVLKGERRVLRVREECGPTKYGFPLLVPDEVWPPEGWVPPLTREEARGLFWQRCKACGWHAPGQRECGPPLVNDEDEIMKALERALGKGGAS